VTLIVVCLLNIFPTYIILVLHSLIHILHLRIYNPNDGPSWQKMAAIKSNILRRMDTAPAGVRICCIKFIQRVVQVQTPGLIADPRVRRNVLYYAQLDWVHPCLTGLQRPEQNELSLSLVPRDHPLIPPPTLEAEAIGLLDRALSVFQESEW